MTYSRLKGAHYTNLNGEPAVKAEGIRRSFGKATAKYSHITKRFAWRAMNTLLFLVVVLSLTTLSAHAQLNDGPYVFYRGDSVKVVSVKDGKAVDGGFVRKRLRSPRINVTFPENSQYDFQVELKGMWGAEDRVRYKLPDVPSEYVQPRKMLVLSDIEGEFFALRQLLIAGGVMDEKYNWTFGRGHLVICGDLFDRGKHVVEGLWLLYRLEQLARAEGGVVHVILGNHDIMNLSGDLRYVNKKYMESAKAMGMDYMQLYDTRSELGRWLRTRNMVERIGKGLYMHAGISKEINALKLSVPQINKLCRPYYDKGKPAIAAEPSVAVFFSGKTSPFWYRGYFHEPKATLQDVEETLALYGVTQIVVGHTIVEGNVGFYYGGKVLGLDVDQHGGDHQAALFEKGVWHKIDDKGKKSPIEEH
jgi:hypothetical protein